MGAGKGKTRRAQSVKGIAKSVVTKKNVVMDALTDFGFVPNGGRQLRRFQRNKKNELLKAIRYSVIDGKELPTGIYEYLSCEEGNWKLERDSFLDADEQAMLSLKPFKYRVWALGENTDSLNYSAVTGKKLPRETASETIDKQLTRKIYHPDNGGYAIFTANDAYWETIPKEALFTERETGAPQLPPID
jgi:hypothetical protein